MVKFIAVFALLVINYTHTIALVKSVDDSIPSVEYNTKQWIAPAALFTVGSSFAAIPSLRKIESNIYDGFNPKRKFTHIDDYTQ